MRAENKQKILIAIAYFATHNIKMNKTKIANYTSLSWVTVNKYFNDFLSSEFLLSDISNYEKKYKRGS